LNQTDLTRTVQFPSRDIASRNTLQAMHSKYQCHDHARYLQLGEN
jgi:hypothetical protein